MTRYRGFGAGWAAMATLPDDRYRRADHCLVFLHLPKTAGTTLASSLAWNFPVDPRFT